MGKRLVQIKDENGNWVDYMTIEEHNRRFPGEINNIPNMDRDPDNPHIIPLKEIIPEWYPKPEIPDGVKAVGYVILVIICVVFFIGYHSGLW